MWTSPLKVYVKDAIDEVSSITKAGILEFFSLQRTKEILSISVDESRHLVYTLCSHATSSESRIIDVYNLGAQDEQFSKRLSINQSDILSAQLEQPMLPEEREIFELQALFAIPLNLS